MSTMREQTPYPNFPEVDVKRHHTLFQKFANDLIEEFVGEAAPQQSDGYEAHMNNFLAKLESARNEFSAALFWYIPNHTL